MENWATGIFDNFRAQGKGLVKTYAIAERKNSFRTRGAKFQLHNVLVQKNITRYCFSFEPNEWLLAKTGRSSNHPLKPHTNDAPPS